jgi:hypothetical protein
MIDVSDVYDFYGLTCVIESSLGGEEQQLYAFFLKEIQRKYVVALKKRIKEEAGYLGLDIDGTNLETLMGNMKKGIDEQISKQANSMMRMGGGFNLMETIKQVHTTKPKGMENAAASFRVKEKQRPAFGGEPWAKISEAFLGVEKATSNKEIILAIDYLNDLAHNCCAVLFDLTGTRGGGGDAHKAIQDILDEKKHAKTPKEFASKMSNDVKSFLKANGILR